MFGAIGIGLLFAWRLASYLSYSQKVKMYIMQSSTSRRSDILSLRIHIFHNSLANIAGGGIFVKQTLNLLEL